MSEELKPCPFCGNELEKTQHKLNPTARCVTPDCRGGKMPAVTLDSPQDVNAWNTRKVPEGFALVPAVPTEKMIEAAEDAYMPFGEMGLALEVAVAAAQDRPE
jgi:hypothetical protein